MPSDDGCTYKGILIRVVSNPSYLADRYKWVVAYGGVRWLLDGVSCGSEL